MSSFRNKVDAYKWLNIMYLFYHQCHSILWKSMTAIVDKKILLIYTVLNSSIFLKVIRSGIQPVLSGTEPPNFWVITKATLRIKRKRPKYTLQAIRARSSRSRLIPSLHRCAIFIVDCWKLWQARERLRLNVPHMCSWRKSNTFQSKYIFSSRRS